MTPCAFLSPKKRHDLSPTPSGDLPDKQTNVVRRFGRRIRRRQLDSRRSEREHDRSQTSRKEKKKALFRRRQYRRVGMRSPPLPHLLFQLLSGVEKLVDRLCDVFALSRVDECATLLQQLPADEQRGEEEEEEGGIESDRDGDVCVLQIYAVKSRRRSGVYNELILYHLSNRWCTFYINRILSSLLYSQEFDVFVVIQNVDDEEEEEEEEGDEEDLADDFTQQRYRTFWSRNHMGKLFLIWD